MNAHAFPSALRELRADLSNRNVWVALVAVSIVLGISGPFGTFSFLSPVWRLIYWTIVVICTYCIGSIISNVARRLLEKWQVALRLGASALLVGLFVTAFLSALNFAAFEIRPTFGRDLVIQLIIVTVISPVVEVGSFLVVTENDQVLPPPLLSRLPFEKRGDLIALSVSDHYVEVTTTKGSEVVLLRLSDAIKEVGDTEGLQVHRSHWVGLRHVASVARNGDRATLTLSNGQDIPVSRSFMTAIKQAGLLAGRPNA